LESKGFGVLHICRASILAAFRELGIDASLEDGAGGTTEKQFREEIAKWESLRQSQATNRLLAKLHALHQREIADFKQRLEAALTRGVASIRLTVLRGHSVECSDVEIESPLPMNPLSALSEPPPNNSWNSCARFPLLARMLQ
jgi:hypothetical protein